MLAYIAVTSNTKHRVARHAALLSSTLPDDLALTTHLYAFAILTL